MEPRIQYAKTSDGVRIACCAMGDGLPLVLLPPLPGHLQLEWEVFRELYGSIPGRGYRLIRYDFRGSGLSDHTGNWMQEEFALDLEAVLDCFGVDTCAILALGPSSMRAISFAASRPERVSHLVLWEGFAAFEQITSTSQIRALTALLDVDHIVFTETISSIFFGWGHERARRYAAALREALTLDELREAMQSLASLDARPSLNSIQAPTLIIHNREVGLLTMEAVRDLAASIPDARLLVLEGATVTANITTPETESVIDEFLLGDREPVVARGLPSGTAIILFADIADSTELTERLGDAAFREKARDLDAALRIVIRENSGTPIEGKLLGDGVLAVFTSARQAIEAAMACADAGNDGGLPLHLGLHAGDVIREENNVYGGAGNIASRVAGLSAAGEVLGSDTVRSLARTSAGVRFEDRGGRGWRGVGEAVRV